MWLLESAKDRILGVDTPGQHVPSCVRYGITCLLIRNTIYCVFLGGVGIGMVFRPAHMVQEELWGKS
jgi:hypothetical protein